MIDENDPIVYRRDVAGALTRIEAKIEALGKQIMALERRLTRVLEIKPREEI